jgi:flagellar basal-body rod protein FlgC
MELISDNIANSNSTGGADGPYRRKVAVLAPAGRSRFEALVARFRGEDTQRPGLGGSLGDGVEVVSILEDQRDPVVRYDPEHPDAGDDGYVRYPNIDLVREMVDLMSASRSYRTNVSALNASKDMVKNALQIGR